MKRVALYIRVSTEEQARVQEGSLISQRKRLEEYVAVQNRRENNWGAVVDIYCDEGKSAKDMNRPEFQRLLQDLRLGRINLILATELSRLSRSIRDFCELWDLFKKHDTGFITLRENFDTTTAAGEMMVFNLINFAQFERKQTGERISANFKSRAERGLWNGGVIPLGYKRDPSNPGKLALDKKESKTIRLIFDIFLKTGNLRETCLKLNELGLRTKEYVNHRGEKVGGNHFTVASLHHLLTNATFTGMREINKKQGDLRLVKAQWPAIVDKAVFKTIGKRLEQNKRRYKPDDWKTYPYPLTGIAVCGECGSTLNGKSAHGKTQKHHYYDHPRTLKGAGSGHVHKCRIQRLRSERVEQIVLSSLKTILSDPTRIKEAVRVYQRAQKKGAPDRTWRLNALTREIQQLELKQKNLIARITELPQSVSAEPFYIQLTEVQNQLAQKLALKQQLEIQVPVMGAENVKALDLERRISRTVSLLERVPVETQRQVFENVIQFAEFHPSKLRLGIFARELSATGTLGGVALSGSSSSRSRNLSIVGSTTFKYGGRGGI